MKIVHARMDSQSAAPRVLLTVELGLDDVDVVQRGIYTSVGMTRSAPRGKPGEPALPWRKLLVYIPDDARVVAVQASAEATCVMSIPTMIEPIQPDVPIQGPQHDRRVSSVAPDPAIYASSDMWPATIAQHLTVRRLGNKQLAEIAICPFRYQPAQGKLELVQSLKLELSFRGGDVRALDPEGLASVRYDTRAVERVKKLVVNPEHVASRLRLDVVPRDLTRFPELAYVIITSQALTDSFEPLAKWRSMRGLPARIVAVEDICNNNVPDTNAATFWMTSGYADGGTRDAAEAVRNFIKWAARNWATELVLLGGDTEVIPARKAWYPLYSMPYGDLRSSDLTRNLAVEVSASSAPTNCQATNVLDEDANSYWAYERSDRAPWLLISFGSSVPVNRLQLTWGAASSNSYAVQVSMDGRTWHQVHSTTGWVVGVDDTELTCVSARHMRLVFSGRSPIQLQTVRVFGPLAGAAYQFSPTCTRVFLNTYIEPNPTNEPDRDQLVIIAGERKGTVVPHNVDADDTRLGWRYVEDLLGASAVSSSYTSYIEVCGPAEFHGATLCAKTALTYIPTDLYYSDLDSPDPAKHDWDVNDNGIYGERYEGAIDAVNGLADVFVGRVPVTTAAEVTTVVEKIRRYESYSAASTPGALLPMDFATSALLVSLNWYDPAPGVLDEASACNEDIRRMLLAADSSWQLSRLYEDLDDVAAVDLTPDLQPVSTEAVKAAIAEGHNLVSLVSHGSEGGISTISGLCTLNSSDVDDEVNVPAIWYGNACTTNKYDDTTFSEYAVLNTNGGAVAYIGNSRFGWTSDGPMERAFWEEMLESSTLGPMLQSAHLVGGDWQKYSLNLLGDPALTVWSATPKALVVTHPATIDSGTTTSMAVAVTSHGAPVSHATVCASMTEGVHCVSTTDEDGVANLTVRPGAPGLLQLTVSGKNLLPYLGTVRVRAGSPSLTISPLALEFGAVALGKSSTLTVKLTNSGAGPLYLFVTSPNAASTFRWRRMYGRKLSPGASTTLAVSASPAQLGVVRGTLTIRSTSPASPHTIGLSVQGVQP